MLSLADVLVKAGAVDPIKIEIYKHRCLGKQQFASMALAQAHADRVKAVSTAPDAYTLAPYFCRFCRTVHIGRSKARRKE